MPRSALYAEPDRLVGGGYLEREQEPNGLRRKTYRLTDKGRTALEAHAGGAAVISSGNGGLREVSGEHALYLPRIGAPEIAQAVERLIANPAERNRLATEGHARALARFDIHSTAGRHDAILKSLIFQSERDKSSDFG